MSYSRKARSGAAHDRNGEEFVCGLCDIRFASEDTFEDHVEYVHGDDM